MYELSQLFWYRPIFMAELLIAEYLFVSGLKKRAHFFPRMAVGVAACFGFAFVFPIIFSNAVFFSFMFFAFFAFTVLIIKFVYDDSLINILYCALAGYTTQHFAYEVYDLIIIIFNMNEGMPLGSYGGENFTLSMNPFVMMLMLYVYGMTYWLSYLIFASKIRKWDIVRLRKNSLFLIAAFIVLVDIVFGSVVTYATGEDFNKTHIIMLYIYNIACCILALYIQFELPLRKKLERELDIMAQLRITEHEQYLVSKENIELINLKCHDLKHQIRDLTVGREIDKEALAEIENVISIYDSSVQTDNAALDVILTEKSLKCNKNNILLSCIVDGEKLNFMTESDQYSLFGNMLDNAIESVNSLDGDKRTISLSVKAVKSLLSINIHNYYEGKIQFERNLPVSTKKDKEYHGFGMKSIQRICDKYNGEMSITTDNNIFNLNIIFPITDE